MSRHLDEDTICRWLAGERSPKAEAHLAGCPRCRETVASFSAAVEGLPELARERSSQRIGAYDAAWARGVEGLEGSRAKLPAWSGLAKFSAAAIAVAGLGLAMWLPEHLRVMQPAAVEVASKAGPASADEDAALLKRVDADLAQAVPEPMEPLTKLIDYGSEAKEQ